MKNWSRLILPLGLGLVAMGINAAAMQNRLSTKQLVAVKRSVAAGERLTVEDLAMVEFSYPTSHLQQHFWMWNEREILLGHVGTPVALDAGCLVPKQVFQNYGRTQFSIPEGHVLVGVRFNETAISSADRRLLLPGRAATFRFQQGTRAYGPFEVAYLQPSTVETKESDGKAAYEMGVIVSERDDDEILLLASGTVNSVTGSAE